jgi:hypothetical protein
MHELDPVYLGPWSAEDVLTFLLRLLDLERAAIGDMECSSSDPLSDLALAMQIALSACCILIRKQIARHGGISPGPAHRCDGLFQERKSSEQLVVTAYRQQTMLAEAVDEALSRIADQQLHTVLTIVRRIHLNQVKRLVRILA